MAGKLLPLDLLRNAGLDALLPMQESFLSSCREHAENVLLAPTGSGKTLAFLLSALEKCATHSPAQAIILAPTRELCQQIESVFRSLKSGKNIVCCYGGHAVKTEANRLAAHPEFIIATPGRICDHLRNERIHGIERTQVLIIDEFDKCLEFGFEEEMREVFESLPRLQQKILVSATEIREIPAYCRMPKPAVLDARHAEIQPDIREVVVPCTESTKDSLFRLLCGFQQEKSIVFCNYREVAEDVSQFLEEQKIAVSCYHGGLEQEDRERALIKFRNNSVNTLVCTDLGSRGLDIPAVQHILHFQFPPSAAAYTHRNGRSARQGEEGTAYLLKTDNASLPFYLDGNYPEFYPAANPKVPIPQSSTLYFGAGKRDKVNKVDLVGFLIHQGGLEKQEIGLITVLDRSAYVSIPTGKTHSVLQSIRGLKLKGKRYKIALSR